MDHKLWKMAEQISAILLGFLAVLCAQTAVFVSFGYVQETMYGGGFQMPSLPRQLGVAVAPLAFWKIREKEGDLAAFLGLHVLVLLGLPWLLGENGMQKGIFLAFVAGYLAASFCIRFRKEEELPVREDFAIRGRTSGLEEGTEDPSEKEGDVRKKQQSDKPVLPAGASGGNAAIPALVAVVSFLACAGVGADWACRRIWIVSLVYVFLFYGVSYLQNLDRFIRLNQTSNAHIPVRRMLLQGGGMTAGFGLAAVLVLGSGADGAFTRRMAELLKTAGLWLLRCLAAFLSFLMSLWKGEGQEETEELFSGSQYPEMPEIAETPLWMEVLERIFAILLWLLFLCLVLWMAYRLVCWVVQRFYENTARQTEEIKGTVEIRERLGRSWGKGLPRKKGLPFLAVTPEERIRRSFIQTIRRTEWFRHPEEWGQSQDGSDSFAPSVRKREKARGGKAWEDLARGKTARQLGEAAGLMEGEKEDAFLELAGLYEKARYGKACTREEAKRAGRAAAVLMRR